MHLSRHIPALDGIRGLAILLVLLHHLSYSGGLNPYFFIEKLYYKATYAGWMGVDLFLVLSGFLITGILNDTRESQHFFRNFYVRRSLRIFPLYYGFLVVFFLVFPHITTVDDHYRTLHSRQLWYWTYLANINTAVNGWPKFGYIGHFWSLAIEEQFYVFWPFLVYFLKRRNLCIICAGCILVAFGARSALFFLTENPYPAVFVLTPARMDALAVGALIALLSRSPESRAVLDRWATKVLCIAGITIVGIFIWRKGLRDFDPIIYTIGFTLIAGFFGALLINVTQSPSQGLFAKLFSNNILMFLGRYSYAIYVFHPLVIKLFQKHHFSINLFQHSMGSQLPGQFVYSTFVVGIAIILSLLSWFFWESRFNKLKRMFPYRARAVIAPRL
jgi:peptidoglycan/LPS O-acetylase OafA/YrhL